MTSAFAVTQAFAELLRGGAGDDAPGRVINIASINGINPPSRMDTFASVTFAFIPLIFMEDLGLQCLTLVPLPLFTLDTLLRSLR